jgi:hypothetical protein
MLTIFGACAVTFMMLMYALERRSRHFILAFACGCVLSSIYGFLAGTWPFGVVEAIWSLVALRRYVALSPAAGGQRVGISGRGPRLAPAWRPARLLWWRR